MAEQNLTIFQRMGILLGPNNENKRRINKPQRPVDPLLVTTNPEEFKVTKTELQQQKYVNDLWGKVENDMYARSIHNEPTRMAAYYDFESMEFFPEIAAALDIMSEEACVPSEQGKVLTIFSESERVRSILQDLFNKTLDIETNLQAWTRNTPIRQNSMIPLLNGETITIKELSERVKNGNDVWTYSIQDETKKIVPGKIIWCDLTRRNSELYRITLDDNTYIDTTPDHEYMLRDGSFRRADKLTKGQSLMPFYTGKSVKGKDKLNGYEKIFNPSTGNYKYTHTVVAHECVRDLENEKIIGEQFDTHHVDFNKLNNNPNNLVRMTHSNHFKLHGEHFQKILGSPEVIKKRMLGIDKYLRSDKRRQRLSEEMKGIYPIYFEEYNNSDLHGKHNIIRKNKMLKNWTSTDFKNKTIGGMTISGNKECLKYITNIIKNSDTFIGINKLSITLKSDDNFINLFKKSYKIRKDILKSINPTTLNKIIFRQTNKNYFEFIVSIKPELILDKTYVKAKAISYGKKASKERAKVLNHKVLSVVKINETDDVYCMEVVGPNNEQDRHNFPVCGYDVNGLHSRSSGVFLANCKYGDNFIYLHLEHGEGVVGCTQLPTIEIERFEDTDLIAKKKKIRFQYKTKDLQFEPFQIAHFRLLGDDRKLPYGTCLKGDTRVDIENGVKLIEDINIGDMVWSFNEKNQKRELSKVLDKVNSGKKECFRITTNNYYLDASKEHKIMVVNGGRFYYRNVRDLEIGDLLVCRKNVISNNLYEIDKSKPKENKNGWFNNIDLIPDHITNEFAQLLGFLYGDGWLNKNGNQVSIALGVNEDINDFYVDLLERFSGKKCVRMVNQQAVCSSKLLTTILSRIGFKGKFNEKRIPDWLYETDIEIQRHFIAGLVDADGWITKDRYGVYATHIEMSNEQLIKDIKILIDRMGYKCGNIGSRKRDGGKIFDRVFKKVNESFYIVFYDTYKEQMKKYEIDDRLDDNFIIQPIRSIKSIGEYTTYDIYVEHESHNFYANGVVVHNSILEKARRIYRQLVMSEDAMLIYRVVRAPERRIFKVFVGNMEDSDIEAYIQKIANKFKRTPIVDSKTGQIDLRYNQAGIDQDWFVPVRTENAASPIDTLSGAAPLPIDDIEYLQKKLFAAIRVPAPFLGFGEAVGDGKNLSLLDIRFSRTVNRIQKTMIQELNKIAIIHLFMLGYEEELDNFTLALTNPSTQAELLKIELWSQKLDVYSKAMAEAGNGFSAISMVRGKKEILGMSDEEIALDLQQQRIEKAAAAELANTASVIPKTGVFDKVDKIYGVKPGEGDPVPAEGAPEANNEFGGGPEAGGFGGGSEIGGGPEAGGGGTPPSGGSEGAPQESFVFGRHKPLITEKLISKTDSYNRDIKEMIEKIDKSIL
jgi:intein/homing endonuclease